MSVMSKTSSLLRLFLLLPDTFCWHCKLLYVMCCAIWYNLNNLKHVKNTYGGVLLLVSNTPPWVFFTLFKLYKWYPITQNTTNKTMKIWKREIQKASMTIYVIYRSNCLDMFFKTGILKNFANFQKNTCVESLFDKVAGLKACSFVKKRLQHTCFPVKFAKFLRTIFFTEHLLWLLLNLPLVSRRL